MTFKDKRKLRPTQKPSSPPVPRHTWGRSKVPPAEGRAGRVPPTPTCPWPCAGPALLCVLLLWTAPCLSPGLCTPLCLSSRPAPAWPTSQIFGLNAAPWPSVPREASNLMGRSFQSTTHPRPPL